MEPPDDDLYADLTDDREQARRRGCILLITYMVIMTILIIVLFAKVAN